MRRTLIAMLGSLALLVVAAQVDHPKPPEGYYCTHDDHAPESHQCACVKTCTKDENGQTVVVEDTKCKVYCYKEQCACPSGCHS